MPISVEVSRRREACLVLFEYEDLWKRVQFELFLKRWLRLLQYGINGFVLR